jgi:hypothetical protein
LIIKINLIINHDSAKHAFNAAYHFKTNHTVVEYVNNNKKLQWLYQPPRITYSYSGARQQLYQAPRNIYCYSGVRQPFAKKRYIHSFYRNGIPTYTAAHLSLYNDLTRDTECGYFIKKKHETFMKLANYMFSPSTNEEIKLLMT